MYENKISARQLRRMIFIETFGAGALSIPALACYKEQSGFWSLLFYGLFLAGTVVFFIIFSGKIGEGDYVSKTKTRFKFINFPEVLPQPIKIVYIVRFFINAVALFYFFGKTIQTVYMPESSFLFIIFPAAILLWYSMYTTLQKRARFLEIIFPWIITTYFIAVILSFIGIEKAMQIGSAEGLWQGVFSDNIFRSIGNGYLLLLCSSPIEFLLFLRPAAEERGAETRDRKIEDKDNKKDKNNKDDKGNKTIWSMIIAVAGAFLCNILFCFLAVRTLGPTLTSQSEWPVIKMMQLIRMPGGFLERFDILPIVFWILCMMAVLSGYLYYGWSIFQSQISYSKRNFLGIIIVCLLFFAYTVGKNTFLWTFYLKYKAFVDFPLSLILPILVCFFKRQKDFNYQEKTKEKIEKDKEDRRNIAELKKNGVIKENNVAKYKADEGIKENNIAKYKKNEKIKENSSIKYKSNSNKIAKQQKTNKNNKRAEYFTGIIFLILFPVIFSLAGCQRLTDVEEKNYILSMYVDYPSDEEDSYEFWIARANLSEMEEQSDEIPCQITKIKARNLQQLEEKYLETVPGKNEWNHIYTIFLGSGMAANKTACTRLLKQWDNEWQKSPNVLLALCPETPKKLYKIKNIPAGAAGQEVNLLAEQNKEKYSKQICETPIDYLRARQRKEDKITLYRVTIENGNLKVTRGSV